MSNPKILQWIKVTALLFTLCVTGCGGSSNNSGNPKLPQVTTVIPNIASTPNPTTVTITGKNFGNSTTPVQVMFGKAAAISVTVVSDTKITAVAPANTGQVDVRVTTSDGTSPQTSDDIFGYPPPV